MPYSLYDTGIMRGDPAPRLLSDRQEVIVKFRGGGIRHLDICDRCGHYEECHERQRMGLWVLCEVPDELDMMVVRNMEL